MNFANEVVVITGGVQGLGRGMAEAFVERGSKVVIADIDETGLHDAASDMNVDTFPCDVASKEDVEALAQHVLKQCGQVDVWVNNAGIQIAPSDVEAVNEQKLRKLFDINFFGYFNGCQSIVPIMREQGRGSIININSTAGLDGKPGLSAYASSKFAVKGLTLSLREELEGSGVQVFGVHPGGIQTDIYKEAYPDDLSEYMTVDYAVERIMANLESGQPVPDLVIRRPSK
jgi:NAD(P)-dependent dehydrogenase (short-subunit alcohol dehydrogenase family)